MRAVLQELFHPTSDEVKMSQVLGTYWVEPDRPRFGDVVIFIVVLVVFLACFLCCVLFCEYILPYLAFLEEVLVDAQIAAHARLLQLHAE